MKLVGNGVKLVGEDERIDAEGNRKASGSSNRASRQFCESFTKHYERLANRTPVFGELRNLIDLSIAAAFIQEFHLYEKANWNLGCFADEAQTAVETFLPVQHVEAAINAVWKDGVFMTPIGGGVAIRPSLALAQEALQVDASGELNQARLGIDVSQLADDQWWWD